QGLQALTEAHRKLRELSPYRDVRERYEQVSSMELIPAIRDNDPVPTRFVKVREDLEGALMQVETGVGDERSRLESIRGQFNTLLSAWDEGARRTDDLARQVNETRAEYERAIADLEIGVLVRCQQGNGDVGTWRDAYLRADATYHDAERRWEEIRGPYEQQLRAAEEQYESKRAEYVRVVEELREQLQKAPQEYDVRYKDILAKYQDTCAGEREQVIAAGGLHIIGT